jgi:hypothetical protein
LMANIPRKIMASDMAIANTGRCINLLNMLECFNE